MPTGNQSRSDDASRAAELRASDADSALVAMARHIAASEEIQAAADRNETRRKHPAFRLAHQCAYAAVDESQIAMLRLLPEGDSRDLMLLAGMAAMLSDQLPDFVPETEVHAAKVCEGIKAALVTLSAVIAGNSTGPDTIATLYPELARCIRQDIMVTDALRADAEGR